MSKEKKTCREENCKTCQFHNKDDSCKITGEQNCSKKTQFSKCNNFLIDNKLIHF